jgi:hypothetical protein
LACAIEGIVAIKYLVAAVARPAAEKAIVYGRTTKLRDAIAILRSARDAGIVVGDVRVVGVVPIEGVGLRFGGRIEAVVCRLGVADTGAKIAGLEDEAAADDRAHRRPTNDRRMRRSRVISALPVRVPV